MRRTTKGAVSSKCFRRSLSILISIIAASRYFGTLRTILIATRRPYSGAAGAEGPEGEGGAYAAHTEREREREREREGGREGEFGWADLLFIVTADHRPESTCSRTAHGEQSERRGATAGRRGGSAPSPSCSSTRSATDDCGAGVSGTGARQSACCAGGDRCSSCWRGAQRSSSRSFLTHR